MQIVNTNNIVEEVICPSCFKKQPITEFQKIERGKVRTLKLCRTCRNKKAREVYANKVKDNKVKLSKSSIILKNIVLDRVLLNSCLFLYYEYGVDILIKKPLELEKDLEEYITNILYERAARLPDINIKLAKSKLSDSDKLVFNIYSGTTYIRSKSLNPDDLTKFLENENDTEKGE